MSLTPSTSNLWHTTSFQKSADVFKKTLEIFDSKVAYVKDKVAGNFTIAPLYQPVPGLFAELGKKKGGNVLGLDEDRDLICKQSHPATHTPLLTGLYRVLVESIVG